MTAEFKNCKRFAIMGGTFDPIHYGHLIAAEAVKHQLNVERVVFIPLGTSVHKTSQIVTPSRHRFLMSAMAIESNPFFYISSIEIDRPGGSYTIDTILHLKSICDHDAEIFFITGADAVKEILTWKDSDHLVEICTVVAVTRPGHNTSDVPYKDLIQFLDVPALDISSSDIRSRVANGKTIKYLLPEAVEAYIYKHRLYSNNAYDMEKLHQYVQSALSKKRYTHTLGVAKEAETLAKHHNADTNKAYVAGLLHDCAKEIPTCTQIEKCGQLGIKLDKLMREQTALIHSFLGAAIAEQELNIKDNEILNAIAYHTTGRKGMSLLEKIIFVADFIEPNRMPFDGLNELRELAYKNLDLALLKCMQQKIKNTKNKQQTVYPQGLEALEYYERSVFFESM